MEYLTFNSGGQWDLHKSYGNPPKDEGTPNNRPFKSYSTSTADGQLREDRGTQGSLHIFGQGKHPKPEGVQARRNWAKPPHRTTSEYADEFPGSGE